MANNRETVNSGLVIACLFAGLCVALPITSWVARARGRYRLSLIASGIPIGLLGLAITLQVVVLIAVGVLMNLHH